MSKKKKKVMVYKMPKAQDGMQMAEGAPQEQGGGQDQQMQQLAQQVQQMLEQGADPGQVVAQLVQGGVPPQVVAQILVGLGMPEEQVMPMIEQVMQQMQGAQQQGPPQEAMSPEGQPMMEDGGEPGDPPDKRKVVSSKDYIDPITGKRVNQSVAYATDVTDDGKIINAFADRDFKAANVIDTTGYSAGATEFPYFQDYETMILENGIAPNWGGANSGFNRALLVNKEIGVPELGKGVTNRMTVDRILEQRKILNKKAMGGESQQEQIMQLIQAFSQATGMDPNQVVEQLQSAKSEEEQQAMLQQMMQTVQQGQQAMKGGGSVPAGYHRMPDGSIMADSAHMEYGGQLGASLNPTKDDFLSLKKRMLKELKSGGTTEGFDSNSTKSYVQNLQGAVANHVAKNMRIGMINQQFDKVMQEFDSLPKAEDGFETWAKKNTEPGTDLSTMDPAKLAQLKEFYNLETGSDDKTVGAENLDESVINEKSGDDKDIDQTVQDAIDKQMKHFFPGWGGEQYEQTLGGKWVKRPGFRPAVTREGTGNYDITGVGEMAGKSAEEIEQRIGQVLADPNYAKRINKGYLTRRGKIKSGSGLFGNRPQTTQIDWWQKGMPAAVDKTNTELFQPNGETNNQTQEQELAQGVQQFDKYGNPYFSEAPTGTTIYTDPLTGEQTSMAPKPTPVIDEKGRIRTPNETGNFAEGESELMTQYMNEGMSTQAAARKAKREIAKQNPIATGYEQPLSKKEQKLANDPYYGKTAQEIYQLVDDPKKAEKLIKKYGAQNEPLEMRSAMLPQRELPMELLPFQQGGLVSNPGRPVWDFKQMKWSSPKPAQSLLFAQDGLETLPVETIDERELNPQLMGYGPQDNSVTQGQEGGFRMSEQQKKTVDWKQRGQNIFNTASWINENILEPARDMDPTWVATAERQKMVRPTDVKSGAMGFYNQFGDPRFGQTGNLGDMVRPGTGTDQDVYGQFSNYNFYNDLTSGQTRMPLKNGGLVMARLGLQVGDEVELTERDIMELAKYGYEVKRM